MRIDIIRINDNKLKLQTEQAKWANHLALALRNVGIEAFWANNQPGRLAKRNKMSKHVTTNMPPESMAPESISPELIPESLTAAPAGGGVESVLSLFEAGGPVVAILAAMSVIALTIVLIKLWQLNAVKIGSREFVDKALGHWRAKRSDAALETLHQSPNPIAHVMAIAMQGMKQGVSEETVREESARVASAELEKLRSNLRGLELIGSLSPLLGLLGTVLGMIEAFQQLASAGSSVDPSLLSGGIWEALLTTAVGLTVAIPVITVLHWLERAIASLHHGMEDSLTRVFTLDMTLEMCPPSELHPSEKAETLVPQSLLQKGLPQTEAC